MEVFLTFSAFQQSKYFPKVQIDGSPALDT